MGTATDARLGIALADCLADLVEASFLLLREAYVVWRSSGATATVREFGSIVMW